jgi:hypothetical protein
MLLNKFEKEKIQLGTEQVLKGKILRSDSRSLVAPIRGAPPVAICKRLESYKLQKYVFLRCKRGKIKL